MDESNHIGKPPGSFPLLRVWLCGPFQMEWVDPATRQELSITEATEGSRDRTAALSLLALLLCQPNRQAHRDWVMEQFWPEGSRSAAVHRLENIFSCLRKLLRPPSGGESLLHSSLGKKTSGPTYGLDAYPKLWVDTDATIWNVEQAARMERFGDDALPYWQYAFDLLKRGPFLADAPYDPYATWIEEPRSRLEGYARQCVHALSRLYLTRQGEAGKAEAQLLLRTYWQQHRTDEDILRPLLELLGEQERYQEAEQYYQQLVVALADLGTDEKGQLRVPDARTRDIAEYLRTKKLQRHGKRDNMPISREIVAAPTYDIATHISPSSLATTISQSIILAMQELGNRGASISSATLGFSQIQKHPIDFTHYERNVRIALQIHRTSNAQSLLHDLNNDIDELEMLEDQMGDDMLSHLRTLLVANDLLATKIVKDQKQYTLAYAYANHAVRVAKSLANEALLATARFTRGCTKLEWGLFGVMKQGRFQQDNKKIQDAIHDFQEVLALALRQSDVLHPQLQGSTQLQLSRAQLALKHVLPERGKESALLLANQAADRIGCNPIDDPYVRLLMTGTLSGLHEGGYRLIKAGILNIAGLSEKALIELSRLKSLTEQTYGQDETRYHAWSDIAMSEALLELEEYQEATLKIKGALIACHHINSIQNVTVIADIYSRVIAGSYGTSTEVRELGDMLNTWYGEERRGSLLS
jgi:DNA-binding SARP family transcriptional activator